jgi:diadenosine tetraphosphatase ApaH/serine/threonine PP2A family protein phosphatase
MLWRPEALTEFAAQSPGIRPLLKQICEIAAATREALGEERIAWLSGLPGLQVHGPVALVHASPESLWRAPGAEAGDAELEGVYGRLGSPIVVYGHIHRPYARRLAAITVANTGSVSLSYDGDRRASYLLMDESGPVIRRVEYDVDREIAELRGSGIPHAGWIAKMLALGSFAMP